MFDGFVWPVAAAGLSLAALVAAPAQARPRDPRVRVQIRRVGIDAKGAGSIAVTVGALDHAFRSTGEKLTWPDLRGSAPEVDVSAFFASGRVPMQLVLDVTPRGCLTEREEIWVWDGRAPDEDGVVRYVARVAARRAGLVCGRVVEEGGRGVPGVTVGAFRLRRNRPARDPTECTKTREDGRFSVRVDAGGRYLLAAAGAELAPGSLAVTAAVGATKKLPDWELQRGAAIRGVVKAIPADLGWLAVTVRRRQLGRHLHLRGLPLFWVDEHVVSRSRTVRTEAGGRFRVGGLSPGPYRVCVDPEVDGRWSVPFAWPSGTTARVQAPAAGVSLDLGRGSWITCVAQRGGRPVKDVPVSLRQEEVVGSTTFARSNLGSTAADGRFHFLVVPGQTVELRGRGTIPTPPAGTCRVERVELQGASSEPRLVLHVRRPAGGPFRRVLAALVSPDIATGRANDPREAGGLAVRWQELESPTGRFVWGGVPSGRRELWIRPGPRLRGARSFYREHRQRLVVPAKGEVVVHVVLSAGGRIRVTCRDPDGRRLAADCRIVGPRDREVTTDLIRRGRFREVRVSRRILEGGTGETDPALAPGRYRVELRAEGHAPHASEVVVEAGRITRVDAVLEPRRRESGR